MMLILLAGGCAFGDEDASVEAEPRAVSRGADGDCIRAWNATGNAANRSAAAREDGWAVSVGEFSINHPGPGITGAGCTYVFRSSTHWRSYSGNWETDGDLRWDAASMGGRRTTAQHFAPPNAILHDRGRLVRLPPDDGRPVGDREWRAVIDDWYDNGELDRQHRCAAVREALARLPRSAPHNIGIDELRRDADRVC